MISLIISRYDSELLNDKAIIVKERLTQRFPKTEIIDNSNLDRECAGLKGLVQAQKWKQSKAGNASAVSTFG